MKVVIIEDEKLSAEHLYFLLQKIDKNIEVIQYFDTVKATAEALNNGLKADLLFLDIHLADGNSFDIFKKAPTEIPIIFTTAFDNYAIQAFKQNSMDYLLKPIAFNDLAFAIDKFKKHQNTIDKHFISNFKEAYLENTKQYKTRFLVKLGQNIETIACDDIQFFETEEGISFLITKKNQRFAIDFTLDQLETMLTPKDFFRINRKVIIHFKAIEKSSVYFNGRLSISANYLEGDSKIVSRERVADFKRWLDY